MRFAQRGQSPRGNWDGQRGSLRVVHMPENDGVDIDRNRVLGQRLLGIESGV